MPDYLATLLAAEEHRQGVPYVADPNHCERCAEVDRAWVVAVCGHTVATDVTKVCDPNPRLLCVRCGHEWEVTG